MSRSRYSAVVVVVLALVAAPAPARAQLVIPSLPAPELRAANAVAAQAARRERSVTHKVLGAAVGAAAGFFGGGYLGAAIEPNCHCDDPGLKGALIGAPIGAVAGGILGWHLLF
ncbi:MAG: hypothetical protein AB7P99_09020 [Vicinamibacterales bacterium]